MPQPEDYAYLGAVDPHSARSQLDAIALVVKQIMGRMSTATVAKVTKVSNTPGQVAPIGQVSAQPMVHLLDGYGNATPHGEVHGLPYFRFQGGSNAVLCDPQVGDTGILIFADRDISTVKSTGQPASPGSRRRFDMADGIFIPVCLAGAPNQYLAFTDDGITFADKNGNKMVMSSTGIAFTSAAITNTGNITAGMGSGDQVDMLNHTHGGGPKPDPGS